MYIYVYTYTYAADSSHYFFAQSVRKLLFTCIITII